MNYKKIFYQEAFICFVIHVYDVLTSLVLTPVIKAKGPFCSNHLCALVKMVSRHVSYHSVIFTYLLNQKHQTLVIIHFNKTFLV